MDDINVNRYLSAVAGAEAEEQLDLSEKLDADNKFEAEESRKDADENEEKSSIRGLGDLAGVELGKAGIQSIREAGMKKLRNKLTELGVDPEKFKNSSLSDLKKQVKAQVEKAKGKVKESINKAKQKVQKVKEDVQEKVDNISKDDTPPDLEKTLKEDVPEVQNEAGESKPPEVSETAKPQTLERETEDLSVAPEEVESEYVNPFVRQSTQPEGLTAQDIELQNIQLPSAEDFSQELDSRMAELLSRRADLQAEEPSSLDVDFNEPVDITDRFLGRDKGVQPQAYLEGAEDPTGISSTTENFLTSIDKDSVSFMNKMRLEDKLRGRVREKVQLDPETNNDLLGDRGEQLFRRMNDGEDLSELTSSDQEALQSLRKTIRARTLDRFEDKSTLPSEEPPLEVNEGATELRDVTENPVPKFEFEDAPPPERVPPPETSEPVSVPDPEPPAEPPSEPDIPKPPEVKPEVKPEVTAEPKVEPSAEPKVSPSEGADLEESLATAGEEVEAGGGIEDPISDVIAGATLFAGATGLFTAPEPKTKEDAPPQISQTILNPAGQL